jgi:hypothetical protein
VSHCVWANFLSLRLGRRWPPRLVKRAQPARSTLHTALSGFASRLQHQHRSCPFPALHRRTGREPRALLGVVVSSCKASLQTLELRTTTPGEPASPPTGWLLQWPLAAEPPFCSFPSAPGCHRSILRCPSPRQAPARMTLVHLSWSFSWLTIAFGSDTAIAWLEHALICTNFQYRASALLLPIPNRESLYISMG